MAQGVLLVTCATSLAMMSAGNWREKTQEPEEDTAAFLPVPKEDAGDIVWPEKEEDTKGDDAVTEREEDGKENAQSEVDGEEKKARDGETGKAETATVYKADLRLPVEERVRDLLSKTHIRTGETVNYAALLTGERLSWSVPYALIRFDELAYIYWEAMKAEAPKMKDAALTAVRAALDGENLTLELTVDIKVTNRLLKALMGSDEERAKVTLETRVADGKITVQGVTAAGSKAYKESMLKLGSDYLFGTEDYLGYVRETVANVGRSLGEVKEASSVRYGVVVCGRG